MGKAGSRGCGMPSGFSSVSSSPHGEQRGPCAHRAGVSTQWPQHPQAQEHGLGAAGARLLGRLPFVVPTVIKTSRQSGATLELKAIRA